MESIRSKLVQVYKLLKTERVFYYDIQAVKDFPAPAGINKEGIIVYNPELMNSIDSKHQYIVLAHEILHDLLDHYNRCTAIATTEHDMFIANLAADHIVNSILLQLLDAKDAQFIQQRAFLEPSLLGKDVYMEYVYRYLQRSSKELQFEKLDKSVQNSKSNVTVPSVYRVSMGNESYTIVKLDKRSATAYPTIEGRSKDVALLSGILGLEITISRQGVSLAQVLRHITLRYVSGHNDVSFLHVDPSYLPLLNRLRVFLPTVSVSREKANIIYAIDTSSSITDTEFEQAISTIYRNKHLISEKSKVMFFTSDVEDIRLVKEIVRSRKIRRYEGGTDINPVFQYAERQKCDMLIVITDMLFEWPPKPRIKNLVFVTQQTNLDAPYGLTIKYT